MQGVRVVSSLVKQVMAGCRLTQRELADVLGVSLDRVKSLTSGRVKKLDQQEVKALVEKLHVRGDWLATGEGEMFQSDAEQTFGQKLRAVGRASQAVASLPLPAEIQRSLQSLLFAVETCDADLVMKEWAYLRQPAAVDTDALEKAVEYVEDRLALIRRNFTPKQKAKAIRLAYVLTMAERQGTAAPADKESLFDLLR